MAKKSHIITDIFRPPGQSKFSAQELEERPRRDPYLLVDLIMKLFVKQPLLHRFYQILPEHGFGLSKVIIFVQNIGV